jgi:hypothetical protein
LAPLSIFYLVPFLAVREEFHPKRNQARQKLATLPDPRFKDLASDVYYELTRRYPHIMDADVSRIQIVIRTLLKYFSC